MNPNLCAKCNVCEDRLPVQVDERILILEPEDAPARVLVLDDPETKEDYELAMKVAARLLGSVSFAYSATVRCDHVFGEMSLETLSMVTSRCAVWTNLISEGRLLILSTVRGLVQLKVGLEWKEGDVFRVGKLGVVLCIPPLLSLLDEFPVYKRKVERAMREVGVLA